MQTEEKKPFWGPHRYLQTIVLVKQLLTTTILSSVIWISDCELEGFPHQLCLYDRINSQIAIIILIPYNQLYYLYQHADMSFINKCIIQLINFLFSWWVMIVIFANIPRLCITEVTTEIGTQVLAMLGIIYLSYAFMYQLHQMVNGLISISISCIAVHNRKKNKPPTINQDQIQQMKSRLEALQLSRINNQV